MKFAYLGIILIFFLGISATSARAMSVTISNFTVPSFINEEVKIVEVTVSTTSSDSAYLRPVFFQTGTSNYFGCGMGLNVASFVCTTTASDYPMISGSGTFAISVKPDVNSSYYASAANSDLSFKVRRCTSSCAGGDSDSNVLPVHFTTTTPVPTVTPSPVPSPSPTTLPPQPVNISLNEFVACPASNGQEWLELYNNNDFTVTLSGWQMKDDKDNVSVLSGQIGAKSYAVFNVNNLNNDLDTVRLYDGAGFAVESKHYDTCSSSMSWAKKSDGSWAQTQNITKGSSNQFTTPTPTASASPSPSLKPITSPTPDPTTMEGADVLGEATISGNLPSFGARSPMPSPISDTNMPLDTKTKSSFPLIAGVALGAGVLSLVGLGGYLWYDWKKQKKKNLYHE